MRALLRSVFLLGLSTVANTGVSVVRNKLLAVVLGPAGVGLFAQMFGIQTTLAGIVPLGLQTGALRYIALYRSEDPQRLARFVSTAARLFLWLSTGAIVICLLFLKPLNQYATGDPAYLVLLIPPLLGVPFLVQSLTWLTFVQAGLDIRSYSRALVLTSIAGLLVVMPLVLMWKLKGAAIHLLLFAVVGWVIARWTAARAMGPELRRAVGAAPFDRESVRLLGHFGAANFIPFVLPLVFPFILRAEIVQDAGLGTNGIYQALYAISTQYLAIPLSAMAAYSFPRISQLHRLEDINLEVNHAVRVAVLFSAAGILGILLCRDLVIQVLFSKHFMTAIPLFPVQLVGDLVKTVSFAIQLPLLPLERHRARNVLTVVQFATYAAVFFAFPPGMRVWGAVWGHAASWGMHLVTHVVYTRRANGFRFSPENLRLLATSFAAVLAVALLPFPDWRWRLVGVGIAVLWAILSITRREIEQVLVSLRARLQAVSLPRIGGEDA